MHKSEKTKIKKCKTCNGTGKIRVCNEIEMHNMDIESCPYCFGDGSLIQITTTEYFRKTHELTEPLIR